MLRALERDAIEEALTAGAPAIAKRHGQEQPTLIDENHPLGRNRGNALDKLHKLPLCFWLSALSGEESFFCD